MSKNEHAILKGYAPTEDEHGLLEMIDTFDRPAKEFTLGAYSGAGVFAEGFENKPGKRLPKTGVYAGAGLGVLHGECSILELNIKGPNAGVGAAASLTSGVKAMAKAELASYSASAGPVKAKVGVAADTGIGIGPDGAEVQVLGTGMRIGRRMAFTFLGSGIEFDLW